MVVSHVFLIVHVVVVNRVKHHIWCNLVDIQRVRWLHIVQSPTNNHMTCAELTIETLEQAVDMFKIYNKESKETPMASLCFYYQLWIYFTPRSVSIVGFGHMGGGWIGPWFERPCGRRNSSSGVDCGRGGIPSARGGAWCCALVFGVGYFFGVLVLHRRCLAGFWVLGARFLAFSRRFAAFRRFSWIGSAGAVLCGHWVSGCE